jgi:hypothetical protein
VGGLVAAGLVALDVAIGILLAGLAEMMVAS